MTGGAGFIGSAVIRNLLASGGYDVLNFDLLTYAANPDFDGEVANNTNYRFIHGDVADGAAVASMLASFRPDAVMHLAAESHVDRSIDGPEDFIRTNVVGTTRLLMACTQYWEALPASARDLFRFQHISTDEVFGDLGPSGQFSEDSPYQPNSPYAASKAASDHFVRAWNRTYGLPVVLSNCSNNYGPYQFPEKLIPLMIVKGLREEPLPVYGNGQQIRDWLYIGDHARALRLILENGRVAESYNVGGNSERANLDIVHAICDLLDELHPRSQGSHRDLIAFVEDRPGHDLRYAIDFSKIAGELEWTPTETFETGLEKTVRWYLANREWWEPILAGTYAGGRLGGRQAAAGDD